MGWDKAQLRITVRMSLHLEGEVEAQSSHTRNSRTQ